MHPSQREDTRCSCCAEEPLKSCLVTEGFIFAQWPRRRVRRATDMAVLIVYKTAIMLVIRSSHLQPESFAYGACKATQ